MASSFFHTLVVFGAAASLTGCGGRTAGLGSAGTEDPGDASGTGGAGGDTGASGHPGAGGRTGTGGVKGSGGKHPATGGFFGGGGVIGVAGSGAAGGPVTTPDSAQWNCESYVVNCATDATGTSRFQLSGPCPVEASRPRTAGECGPNAWFECDLAILDGVPLTVNCQCVPANGESCGACSVTYLGSGRTQVDSCSGPTSTSGSKRCSCAYTGILR